MSKFSLNITGRRQGGEHEGVGGGVGVRLVPTLDSARGDNTIVNIVPSRSIGRFLPFTGFNRHHGGVGRGCGVGRGLGVALGVALGVGVVVGVGVAVGGGVTEGLAVAVAVGVGVGVPVVRSVP